MKPVYLQVIFCVFLYLLNINPIQTANDTELDWTASYCFQFTWLGPEYDNQTNFNGTCDDYFEDTDADGIPCKLPLVVTFDGTPPDIDYIWENHQVDVLCRRNRGYVCAKYSYFYDNEVQNVTYMCTKVYAIDEGPVTKGCYTQTIDGYDVEMCVCESSTGPYKPCNAGMLSVASVGLVVVAGFMVAWI